MNQQQTTFLTASRGLSWSFVSSVVALLFSLLAQFALGRLLSKSDFGIYAIAISCSNVFIVFRDGGVNRWLSRMTRDEFDRSAGQAMAVTFVSCFVVAFLICICSIFAGRLYEQPQVTTVMLVLAFGLLISPYSIVGLARMNVDLMFREMAWIKLSSALLRYGLTIYLAFLGFGALSFAWPVVAVTILETILYALTIRMPVDLSKFQFQRIREVLTQSKWSLFGSFSESVVRQCDYAVLGLLVPVDVVGVYFFAFQLAMQPVLLFSESLRKVTMPIFARFANDQDREIRSIKYASLFIGMIAAPALLLLSVTAEPILNLLWGTKWLAAVEPLQILAMVMPFQLLSLFVETLLQSKGLFRYWTFALLIRGVGLGIAAAIATRVTNSTPGELSAVIGLYLALSAIIEVYWLMKRMRLSSKPIVTSLPIPLISSIIVAVVLIAFFDGSLLNGPLDRFLISATLFLITIALVLWFVCRESFQEVVHLLRRTKAG